MLYGLYISGLAAVGQGVKLDVIANNLANVNTTGYRRDHVSFQERMVEALEDRPDLQYYNHLVHRYGGAPFIDNIQFDRQAGPMSNTNRQLDFAIVGPGYFTVKELSSGKLFYTRAGNFIMSAQGKLTTADGKYQVMNNDGTGVEADLGDGALKFRLSEDARFFRGDEFVAQLQIRDFPDPDRLLKYGDNLYQYTGSDGKEATGFRTFQATLEGSSVNPIAEMVEMIKTTRAMETNLQMISLQDGTLDRLINGFGRTT